jgi:hypothetical protein
LNTAVLIGSRGEVLSDQLVIRCCNDRLSWHDLSGLGPNIDRKIE